MPIYDKNNNLIEHILDAAGNELNIPPFHAAAHVVRVKIPKLSKPADDYSIALRYDYYYHKFPSLANNINLWSSIQRNFSEATYDYSQDLAYSIGSNCVSIHVSDAGDPWYIYAGSNFNGNNKKGCEPWYRSYTYDYAASPYSSDFSRGDEQTLACGRVPGDNFNPTYSMYYQDDLIDMIKSQATDNYNYRERGIQTQSRYLNIACRLGALTQLDPQRRWENLGELIQGTINGEWSANNIIYAGNTQQNTTNSIAQYIMYFDAEYKRYMFFNIHTLRRQSTIKAITYTATSYAVTFDEYISVDVSKPFYLILDEQAYNYMVCTDNVSHAGYQSIGDFDTLIRCRIENKDGTKTTYSKQSLGYDGGIISGGHLYVLAIDLYNDVFLAGGWKYPENQTFVGVHPSDDPFLFNEFNVVNSRDPVENYYSTNSPTIETVKSLEGTSGILGNGNYLRPFARMWLDFEAI